MRELSPLPPRTTNGLMQVQTAWRCCRCTPCPFLFCLTEVVGEVAGHVVASGNATMLSEVLIGMLDTTMACHNRVQHRIHYRSWPWLGWSNLCVRNLPPRRHRQSRQLSWSCCVVGASMLLAPRPD